MVFDQQQFIRQLKDVCCWHQGGLSVNYSDNYYHLSQRHSDVPRLTQQHHEAMALFNEIACSDALRMDSMLQPGDIQLLNNHTQLHTRAEFQDFPVSRCSPVMCSKESRSAAVNREACPVCFRMLAWHYLLLAFHLLY